MRKSNCALDEDSAGVTVVGSRTKLGVPALTSPLQQTSLNVATRSPELTQLAVADSKEKKFRAFSGDPAMWSCVLTNYVAALLNGGNFCKVDPSHSDILDVSRPQTNNDSVWVSLCAGQVLFDTVYLLVEWTCASTKSKTGQEVSSAKRLAVLVPDASLRRAVVNRVCTWQSTRHGQWLCNGWHVSTATGRKAFGKGRREVFVNYCLASLPVFVRPSPWVHSVYSWKPLSQKVSNTPFRARAGNRWKQTGLALRPTQNMESWQLTQKISDSTVKHKWQNAMPSHAAHASVRIRLFSFDHWGSALFTEPRA